MIAVEAFRFFTLKEFLHVNQTRHPEVTWNVRGQDMEGLMPFRVSKNEELAERKKI